MNGNLESLMEIEVGDEFDGFEVFVVGGAVRDALRGEDPDDIDIMAVPKPNEVDESIPRLQVQMKKQVNPETAFPVFMDTLNREVALPRTEKSTGNGTQDFEMSIVSSDTPVNEAVAIDLERRDLTMNALAFNIRTGELFDPFGGKDDIEQGIVRHVSEAFREDPLRVVRMARFAGRFDEQIAPETRELAREIAPKVETLPRERLVQEMRKAFKQSEKPNRFFTELEKTDALQFSFPAIRTADMDEISRIIRLSHENIGNDVNGLFGALGFALGSDATNLFIENNESPIINENDEVDGMNKVLTNEERRAMRDGATMIETVRIIPQISNKRLLDVSLSLNSSNGLNRENAVGIAGIMPIGSDKVNFIADTDEINRRIDIAINAIETVDGQHVMEAEGIDQSDIGDTIGGGEFGDLIEQHRIKMIEENL